MAKCDEGYFCDVCGKEVEGITQSDLYLRYVMGKLSAEELHRTRERHIRCNPAVAQYIVDPKFEPVRVQGPFAKQNLDPGFVAQQQEMVTRAWRRLKEIPHLHIPILEYPLPKIP